MYNHPGTPMPSHLSVLDNSFQPDGTQNNVFLDGAMPYKNNTQITLTKVSPAFPEKFLNGDKTEVMVAFDNTEKLNSTIFEVLKPVYIALRTLGIFPITHTGQIFDVTTQWLIYSSACLLTVFGYTCYLKWSKVHVLRNAEGRFEEAVIDYLFTVYLVPIIINPITLYEAKKQADVLTQMVSFEKIYMKIAKKRLVLNLRNKPLILTIALLSLGCVTMVITHITMANFVIYQVLPYCYINVITYMLGAAWYVYCDVIGNMATVIVEDFQSALKNINTTNKLADYRSLWMLLSKIIRNVGNSFGYALTFLCLYLFFVITLTIYGLLSQIQDGMGIKDIGLAITAVSSITMLFFICDEAHYASTCVRSYFQKKILLVELSWMSEDAQQEVSLKPVSAEESRAATLRSLATGRSFEDLKFSTGILMPFLCHITPETCRAIYQINMFLRATEMNPTDMCLCGFFDVNRNLFKSLLATMVTYLVVLLQFQISIPESSESPNATLITTLATPVKGN